VPGHGEGDTDVKRKSFIASVGAFIAAPWTLRGKYTINEEPRFVDISLTKEGGMPLQRYDKSIPVYDRYPIKICWHDHTHRRIMGLYGIDPDYKDPENVQADRLEYFYNTHLAEWLVCRDKAGGDITPGINMLILSPTDMMSSVTPGKRVWSVFGQTMKEEGSLTYVTEPTVMLHPLTKRPVVYARPDEPGAKYFQYCIAARTEFGRYYGKHREQEA
jgi:hypothetical protein